MIDYTSKQFLTNFTPPVLPPSVPIDWLAKIPESDPPITPEESMDLKDSRLPTRSSSSNLPPCVQRALRNAELRIADRIPGKAVSKNRQAECNEARKEYQNEENFAISGTSGDFLRNALEKSAHRPIESYLGLVKQPVNTLNKEFKIRDTIPEVSCKLSKGHPSELPQPSPPDLSGKTHPRRRSHKNANMNDLKRSDAKILSEASVSKVFETNISLSSKFPPPNIPEKGFHCAKHSMNLQVPLDITSLTHSTSMSDLPPGFILVPSSQKIGHSIYDPIFTNRKYSTRELAWEVYELCKDKVNQEDLGEYSISSNNSFSSISTTSISSENDSHVATSPDEIQDFETHDMMGVFMDSSMSNVDLESEYSANFLQGGLPEALGVQESSKLEICGNKIHTGSHGIRTRQHDDRTHKALMKLTAPYNPENDGSGMSRWWRCRNSIVNEANAVHPSKIPSPGYLLNQPRKRDRKFLDSEFPPEKSSLGMKQGKNVVWLRMADLMNLNSGINLGVELFQGRIEPNDLIQGNIGDCWLLASLACLAEFPAAIKKRISPGQIPGSYRVTLFDFDVQKWVSILIDDYIPCEYVDDYSNVPFKWVDNENGDTMLPTDIEGQDRIPTLSGDSSVSSISSKCSSLLDSAQRHSQDNVSQHVHRHHHMLPPPHASKVYSKDVKPYKKYKPLFAKPRGEEMWCLLLEKAVAKFLGNYNAIGKGGHEAYALMILTGCSQVYEFKRTIPCSGCGCEACEFKCCDSNCKHQNSNQEFCSWERGFAQWFKRDVPKVGYRPLYQKGSGEKQEPVVLSPAQLSHCIYEYDQRNYLIASCITKTDQSASNTIRQRPDGLYPLHAYSMLTVLNIEGQCLVLVRNPHGSSRNTGKQSEWNGKWSDYDESWHDNENQKVLEACRTAKRKIGAGKSDDGLFWMSFEDFNRIFDKIFVLAKIMDTTDDVTRFDKVTGNVDILQTPNLLSYETFSRSKLPYTLQRMINDEKRIHEKGWNISENLFGTEYSQLSNLISIESMSVAAYDPYLNPPKFVAQNKPLLMQWIKDKGHAL